MNHGCPFPEVPAGLVQLVELDGGLWHVRYPDNATSVLVDSEALAHRCVPSGWPYEVVRREP